MLEEVVSKDDRAHLQQYAHVYYERAFQHVRSVIPPRNIIILFRRARQPECKRWWSSKEREVLDRSFATCFGHCSNIE